MIALNDDELRVLLDAARPIQPHQRTAFLADVAAELARFEVLGPGIVSRVTSRLQRAHLNPPRRHAHSVGKWDR
jgi:hypothetical protein